MDNDAWFLKRAEECERLADAARDESLRYFYRILARQWRLLAERSANRQAA
jgi:hypothetical protein